MTPANPNPNLDQAIALLEHYSFDLAGFSATSLVFSWQQYAAPEWIRDAVIEALYQGRYKAVSVGQVLLMWARRGQPLRHFSADFDRMVCSPLDPRLNPGLNSALGAVTSPAAAALQADEATANAPTDPPRAAGQFKVTDKSPFLEVNHGPPPNPHESLTRFKRLATSNPSNEPVLPLTSPDAGAQPKPTLQANRLMEAIAAADATEPTDLEWPLDQGDSGSGTPPNQPPNATHQISQLLEAVSSLQAPEPIQQFVPPQQGSLFYDKLRSVTLSSDEDTPQPSPNSDP